MTQYTDTQLRDTLLAAAREEFGAAWDGGEPMDPTPGFGAWEGDFLARCAAARPVGRRGRHWGRVVLAAAAVSLLGAVFLWLAFYRCPRCGRLLPLRRDSGPSLCHHCGEKLP